MENDKMTIREVRVFAGLSKKELASLFKISLLTLDKKENYSLKLTATEIIILSLISQIPIYQIKIR